MENLLPGTVLVEDVTKVFRIYHDRARSLKSLLLRREKNVYDNFEVIKHLSFRVEPGQTVALVGSNGSGKSTMLKLIAGILKPTEGSIRTMGKISSLLELGAGFHPDYSGLDNVYLNGSILGLTKAEIDERMPQIVEFSELSKFIDTPVRNYSSGMYMRLAFAIAIHVDPDILLVDEVLAVGDERFQRKCFAKLREFQERGKTIIFVSHDASAVRELCSRAILFYHGEMVADGDPDRILTEYRSVIEEDAHPQAQSSEVVTMDEVEIEQTVGNRYGTRQVVYEQVKMHAEPVLPGGFVPVDGELTLKLRVRAHAPTRSPIYGFTIKRWVSGQWVLAYETNTLWLHIPTNDLAAGETEDIQIVSQITLGRGQYHLTVAIASHDAQDFYDVWEQCHEFFVQGPETWAGIVNLRPEIKMSSAGGNR